MVLTGLGQGCATDFSVVPIHSEAHALIFGELQTDAVMTTNCTSSIFLLGNINFSECIIDVCAPFQIPLGSFVHPPFSSLLFFSFLSSFFPSFIFPSHPPFFSSSLLPSLPFLLSQTELGLRSSSACHCWVCGGCLSHRILLLGHVSSWRLVRSTGGHCCVCWTGVPGTGLTPCLPLSC